MGILTLWPSFLNSTTCIQPLPPLVCHWVSRNIWWTSTPACLHRPGADAIAAEMAVEGHLEVAVGFTSLFHMSTPSSPLIPGYVPAGMFHRAAPEPMNACVKRRAV